MRKYGLPDAARLTQENAESFWDAVKDRDLPRRLRRLQRMEKQMEFFPPFWYYRARSALDTDDRPSALSFFRKYREKRKPVIRTDPYLAASSMNILALAGGDLEREEKLSLLDEVVSNSRNEDWANFIYAGLQFMLLGEREKGAECLQRNVDNGQEPSLSGLLLSNMGRDSLLEGVPKLLSKEIETLTAQVAGKGFLKNQDLLEIYAKDGDPGILASIPSQLQGIDFQTASRAGRKDVLALVIPERWLSGALTAGNGKGNAPSAARVHFSISVLLSGQEACSVTEKNFRPQGEKAKGREPVLSYDSARKSFVLFAEGTFSPGRRGEVRISHDASIPVGLFFEGETESFRTSPKNARDAADKVLTYGIPLFGQIRLLRDALHDTGMLLTQGTKYRPLGLAFQGKSLAWNGDKLIEGEIPGLKGEKRP